MESTGPKTLEDALRGALVRRHVRATPQAMAALLETLRRAPSQIVGDSDTLLLGLLYSGSYTVDVLESAGVNPRQLRALAEYSVAGYGDVQDPIEALLSNSSLGKHVMRRAREAGGMLETAHILEVALNPDIIDSFSTVRFPIALRKDNPPMTLLARRLELGTCDLIAYGTSIVEVTNTRQALKKRCVPLSRSESNQIAKELGFEHQLGNDEARFVIAAINAWFEFKHILTEPAPLCLATIAACAPVTYASHMLAEVGADIKSIDSALDMSSRLSPERDLAGLVLFERKKHIHVGQYTYRNTFLTEHRANVPSRLSLQSIRPVSLISDSTIEEFESLISSQETSENELQQFLSGNPELLRAIGYQSARPHLCLYEEGTTELIPDFILELPGDRGFDILDLKLPTARLVAREPYSRPSAEITKALAQLRKYRNYFDSAKNRRAFQEKYGLEAFRPELIVLIGRSTSFQSRDERREIEEQASGIKLLTYDDLIAYGNSRRLLLPKTHKW